MSAGGIVSAASAIWVSEVSPTASQQATLHEGISIKDELKMADRRGVLIAFNLERNKLKIQPRGGRITIQILADYALFRQVTSAHNLNCSQKK